MKRDLEEHCLLPNLLETYAEWIRHGSCSQIPKNVIIFLLVLLNSFLSAIQGKTSLFAKTSNHSFVWKTTSPFSVCLSTKHFLCFFPSSVLRIINTMMSHLKKMKVLWVCHLFYKPTMLWREWKSLCVR